MYVSTSASSIPNLHGYLISMSLGKLRELTFTNNMSSDKDKVTTKPLLGTTAELIILTAMTDKRQITYMLTITS